MRNSHATDFIVHSYYQQIIRCVILCQNK
ncbi:hypothetical protein YPPY03_3362, partial [Yersinia pestis PY-03]